MYLYYRVYKVIRKSKEIRTDLIPMERHILNLQSEAHFVGWEEMCEILIINGYVLQDHEELSISWSTIGSQATESNKFRGLRVALCCREMMQRVRQEEEQGGL